MLLGELFEATREAILADDSMAARCVKKPQADGAEVVDGNAVEGDSQMRGGKSLGVQKLKLGGDLNVMLMKIAHVAAEFQETTKALSENAKKLFSEARTLVGRRAVWIPLASWRMGRQGLRRLGEGCGFSARTSGRTCMARFPLHPLTSCAEIAWRWQSNWGRVTPTLSARRSTLLRPR
eukprot:TRINITY_DN45833_c0_g1_i1.p2 TRINITY_DN45833_c0_g1~~TRINITY_DN45833_c0_g1_i1.p2  ORF type:complete len:179 (-),score=36.08 TRINITY_DN45833_c0_g1_i1:9-545(-)